MYLPVIKLKVPKLCHCKQRMTTVFQCLFFFYLDTCDETLGFANGEILEASSAMLPCCFPKYASMVAGYHQFAWRPWSNAGLRLADEYVQVNFDKKATVNTILTHGLAKTGQFLRSFYVSYSQNGVHWKYVTHMGKKKVAGKVNSSHSNLLS